MTTATRTLMLAAAAVVLAAAPARAQSAEAESLFRDGKRLMKKGQIAEACDKFEAADHAEATASTELNLADCREKNGQTATAWAMFIKAATTAKRAGDGKRDAEGRRRAAALEPQLVYLTIAVPEDARVEGLVIQRNGTELDPALWDQRVPVDPDEYTVSGEAPGHQPWSTTVIVKTRSKKVEVPVLDPSPEPRRREARRRSDDGGGPAEPRDRDAGARPAPGRWTGKRKWSVALAAVGVAGIGAGIGLGLHASSLEDRADADCPRTLCGTPSAIELNRSARRYALGANLGYAAGGVALLGAAVLWWIGAPAEPATHDAASLPIVPILDARHAGVAYTRSF